MEAESGGAGAVPGSSHSGSGTPRAGSPHGLSWLKAGTRKLAAKLGIHGKKDKEGRGSGSPRPASPAGSGSPLAGGSPLAASPLAASPLAFSMLRPPSGGELAPGMHPPPKAPALGGVLLAPSTPEAVHVATAGGIGGDMAPAGRPAVTAVPMTAAGPAVAPPEGVPVRDFSASGPEVASLQEGQVESPKERLARLRATAQRMEAVTARAGRISTAQADQQVHAAEEAGRLLARQPLPAAGEPNVSPEMYGGVMKPQQAAGPGRAQGPSLQAAPAASAAAKPAAAARPPITASAVRVQAGGLSVVPAGVLAAAPAEPTRQAAAREAAAAERQEGEALTPFRPASVESPHGRLATALAVSSPYASGERQAGTFEEAAQRGALGAEQEAAGDQPTTAGTAGMATAGGEPSLDRWALAAAQPVAAVGGVSGETHTGGAAALAAARMQVVPGAADEGEMAAEQLPLGPALPASAAGGRPMAAGAEGDEGEQEWQLLPQQAEQPKHPKQERPVSAEDAWKGSGLAAADVAAGRHAAEDAAAEAAGSSSDWRPLVQASPAAREEDFGYVVGPALMQGRKPSSPPSAAASAASGGRGAASTGGAEGPAIREGGRAKPPLLAAGGFHQEQDISVFSPRFPDAYEKRGPEVEQAARVLPLGPGATVAAQTEEEVELAPFAAGAQPAKLPMGPFGAAEDVSVFSPEGWAEEGPLRQAGLELDRSTEEEEVDVDSLRKHLQQAVRPPPSLRRSHPHLLSQGSAPSEGPEPTVTPGALLESEPVTPAVPRALSLEPPTVQSGGAVTAQGALEGEAPPGPELHRTDAGPSSPAAAAARQAAAEVVPHPAAASEGAEQQAGLEVAAGRARLFTEQREVGQEPEEAGAAGRLPSAVKQEQAAAAEWPRQPAAAAAGEEQLAAEEAIAAEEEGEGAGDLGTTSAAEERAAALGEVDREAAGDTAAEFSGQAAAMEEMATGLPITAAETVASAASAAAGGLGAAAAAARETAVSAADAVAEEAGAAEEAVAEAPSGVADKAADTVTAAGMEASRAAVESEGELAEAAQEAPSRGGGLVASLAGAAMQAVHAVQESMHSVLQHGRQLAAEADEEAAERAAGGGSEAGSASEEGRAAAAEGGAEGRRAEEPAAPEQAEEGAAPQPSIPERAEQAQPAELAGAGEPAAPRLAGATEVEQAAAAAEDVARGALQTAGIEQGPGLAAPAGGAEASASAKEGEGRIATADAATTTAASLEAAAETKAAARPEAAVAETAAEEAGELAGGSAAKDGAAAPTVLPVSPRAHQQTMKEAVEQEPAVTSSLMPALEGAADPSSTSGASPSATAAPTGLPSEGSPAKAPPAAVGMATGMAGAGAAAGAALGARVLPVAVSSADRRSRAEASRSPAVAASLASKEAPESTAAELAAVAAGQPESLDATADYLSERDVARSREGFGTAAVGREAGPAGEAAEAGRRLRFQDLSGLEAAGRHAGGIPTPGRATASTAVGEAVAKPPEAAALAGTAGTAGTAGSAGSAGPAAPSLASSMALYVEAQEEPSPSAKGAWAPPAAGGAAGSNAAGVVAGAAGAHEAREAETAFEGLVEDFEHFMKDEPLQHTSVQQRSSEAAATEGHEPAAPKAAPQPELATAPSAQSTTGGQAHAPSHLTSAASVGGLREPPPSPTASSSPASGGHGDIPLPVGAKGGKAAEEAGANAAAARESFFSRLQTGSTVGEAAPDMEDVGLAAAGAGAGSPAERLLRAAEVGLDWVRARPLLAAGTAGLLPVLWITARRAAIAVFGDFGPALLLSGAIALIGSFVAWFISLPGVPRSELEMLQQQTAAARLAAGTSEGPATPGTAAAAAVAGGGGGAAAGGFGSSSGGSQEGVSEGELDVMMSPSEPVSAESTEDLQPPGGVLQMARDAVAGVAEGVMEAVEPGREMVGEVVQETEEGGERAEEPGALKAAAAAVAGAATAAAHKVEGLAAGAYHAVVKDAPGTDISGEGAPVKGWAEGARETGEVLRQLEGQGQSEASSVAAAGQPAQVLQG